MSGARANQRLRTRKDLLDAAARLMREGANPTFEEIAEAALVSRATAYRYFQGLDALLLEAALHVAMPTAAEVFAGQEAADVEARLVRLSDRLMAMVTENEPAMRAMLAHSLQQSADGEGPVRQNRRSPLIAAALEPARDHITPEAYDRLSKALVLLMGIETTVVFKDVLQLSDAEAADVRAWAVRALAAAARKS